MTILLYESGSEFKSIALLIGLLIRNSLIAYVSLLEPVEALEYTATVIK